MDPRESHVRQLLRSPSPRKRVVGLAHAARHRVPGAVELATAALADPDEEVRSAAAWALDLLGDPASMEALVGALYDATFSVRSCAGWALVHLGQAGQAAAVVGRMDDVLRSARAADAREMARLVLTYLGGPEADGVLAEAPAEPTLH